MTDDVAKPNMKRQAEAELDDLQAQLSAVLDTVGEGIITIDSDSTIVMVNREVESIWGYAQDELVGQRLHLLMPEEYRTRHTAGLKRYLETGRGSGNRPATAVGGTQEGRLDFSAGDPSGRDAGGSTTLVHRGGA